MYKPFWVDLSCQVGSYEPHWQLLPPRLPLPPTLQPVQSLLLQPDLYRLVWHVLRCYSPSATPSVANESGTAATAAGTAGAAVAGDRWRLTPVSEEVLLSALNLLSLQLHHLLSLLEPTASTYPSDSPTNSGRAALEAHAVSAALAALQGTAAGRYSYRAASIVGLLDQMAAGGGGHEARGGAAAGGGGGEGPSAGVGSEVADCVK